MKHNQTCNKGFTLLELVTVIAIVSILFFFAAERLLKLEVEAERVSTLQVIGILKSALAIEISAHIARGDIKGLNKFILTNPMDRLSETPHNYLGVLDKPNINTISKGQWYFDQSDRTLVYKVKNGEYFQTSLNKPAQIKLQIMPVFDDMNQNGRFDDRDRLKGLRIQSLEHYQWLADPIEVSQFVEDNKTRHK